MSENRRVIRVKDLVIEAENVEIRPKRRRDPFFGGVREDDNRIESSNRYEMESSDHHDHDDHRRKGPFSWL